MIEHGQKEKRIPVPLLTDLKDTTTMSLYVLPGIGLK
jgi:hypothetical protein